MVTSKTTLPSPLSPLLAQISTHGPVGAAIRTVLLRDPETVQDFCGTMRNQILQCDENLVASAAKARLRVQDEAYELLSARDMLADSSESLGATADSAEETSKLISSACEYLKLAVVARENADAALEVISETRALVRMYARAEDMMGNRRIHSALRTLKRLDEADELASKESVLRELIPPTDPLRVEMMGHVRRALLNWVGAVRRQVLDVGTFALASIIRQGWEPLLQVPGMASTSASAKPWFPAVLDDEKGIGFGGVAPLLASARDSGIAEQRRNESSAASIGYCPETDSAHTAPPRVSMRLLLTAILSCRDLDRLECFRSDYSRERLKELSTGIESVMDSYSGDRGSVVKLHSHLATFVAGFFTIERTVESYSSMNLIDPTTLGEMWSQAWCVVTDLSASISSLSSEDAAAMKATETELSSFARVYDLRKDLSAILPSS